MFDIIIKNANIVDGSGSKGYKGDIAVKDGKIAQIGTVDGEAKQIIDAAGLTATPGFIDSHSHGDGEVLEMPDMDNIVLQGVTTIIGGQCGGSNASLRQEGCQELRKALHGGKLVQGSRRERSGRQCSPAGRTQHHPRHGHG